MYAVRSFRENKSDEYRCGGRWDWLDVEPGDKLILVNMSPYPFRAQMMFHRSVSEGELTSKNGAPAVSSTAGTATIEEYVVVQDLWVQCLNTVTHIRGFIPMSCVVPHSPTSEEMAAAETFSRKIPAENIVDLRHFSSISEESFVGGGPVVLLPGGACAAVPGCCGARGGSLGGAGTSTAGQGFSAAAAAAGRGRRICGRGGGREMPWWEGTMGGTTMGGKKRAVRRGEYKPDPASKDYWTTKKSPTKQAVDEKKTYRFQ